MLLNRSASGRLPNSLRYKLFDCYCKQFLPLITAFLGFRMPTVVPVGISSYPHELFLQTKSILKSKFLNIVTYTEMEEGGHFAAMEVPGKLADEVFTFVAAVEDWQKNAPEGKQEL